MSDRADEKHREDVNVIRQDYSKLHPSNLDFFRMSKILSDDEIIGAVKGENL